MPPAGTQPPSANVEPIYGPACRLGLAANERLTLLDIDEGFPRINHQLKLASRLRFLPVTLMQAL